MKMFKVYYFSKLGSTFDKAKEFKPGFVIITNEQTRGMGRFKRSWSSSSGGIYMSIVLEKENASFLTFIAAISTCKAINDVYGVK